MLQNLAWDLVLPSSAGKAVREQLINSHLNLVTHNLTEISQMLGTNHMVRSGSEDTMHSLQFLFRGLSVVRSRIGFPYGPAVRTPGLHPGRPGSTPAMGTW